MRCLRPIVVCGAGLAAAITVVVSGAPATAAPATYAVTTDRVQAAAGWLVGQFVDASHLPAPDGDHFDSKYGSSYYANYGENADVIFALAAAKAGAAKVDAALRYLMHNLDAYTDVSNADGYGPYDGSVAKLALAAIVAGADPTDLGGSDLMSVLAKDECPAASTTCSPGAAANIYSSISESFVVLAEARVGGASAPTSAALDYLGSLQCGNGGFTAATTACGSGSADIDATSYAIMALHAAGGHAAQLKAAVSWLESKQAAGGYWVVQGTPNVNSTGLAAAALQGEGADVSAARTWLRAQQVPAGAVGAGALKYAGRLEPTTTSATSPSVLATAQGVLGLVDGASLATLTAVGSASGAAVFAPRAAVPAATVRAGATQPVSATGFAPGEKVRVVIHSTPVTLATVPADALGSVHAAVRIPASTAAGAHDLTLTGATSGLSASRQITVTVAPAPNPSPATSSSHAVAATSASSAPDTAVIAATGLPGRRALALSIAGLAAVLGGTALTLLGRRREH